MSTGFFFNCTLLSSDYQSVAFFLLVWLAAARLDVMHRKWVHLDHAAEFRLVLKSSLGSLDRPSPQTWYFYWFGRHHTLQYIFPRLFLCTPRTSFSITVVNYCAPHHLFMYLFIYFCMMHFCGEDRAPKNSHNCRKKKEVWCLIFVQRAGCWQH